MRVDQEIEIRVKIRRHSADFYRIVVVSGEQVYFECGTDITGLTIDQATALLAAAVRAAAISGLTE